MRILLAIAVMTLSFAGVAAAKSTNNLCVVARNDQRALPPLKHYYPTTGVKPKIGRAEDLSAPSNTPEGEQTYSRRY